jgi:hypothetical protein
MPTLLQNSDDLPHQVRRLSQLRSELEELTEGQVLMYGPEELAHTHRQTTGLSRNRYACRIQEMAGLINRSNRSTRLVTAHHPDGSIYISCNSRRPTPNDHTI